VTDSGLNRFARSTVVVAGADNVLGLACATRFAEEGARVMALGPDVASVDRLGDRIEAVEVDLGDEVAIAADLALGEGSVDVLVNAHLAIEWTSIEDADLDRWAQVTRINLLGPVIATKTFLPYLKASSAGSIVNISSVDGIFGNPYVPSYSASKGGVITFTHVAAHELAKYSIRVNCVARAMLNDNASTGAAEDYLQPIIDATPLGRAADASEVAAVVAFLASSDASFVSGETVVVDGGRTSYTPYTGG